MNDEQNQMAEQTAAPSIEEKIVADVKEDAVMVEDAAKEDAHSILDEIEAKMAMIEHAVVDEVKALVAKVRAYL